jgi:alpha-glucosidase (family GH31 glycosyl hydrolase)/putative sterol carrier protein
MTYTENFSIDFKPLAHPDAVVTAPGVRFAVLTSRLIRLEYSPTEAFEDRPSQAFWYREQPPPDFQVRHQDSHIQIETAHLHLNYVPHDAGFDQQTLSITLKELDHTWHYGDVDPDNLLGTARTLDQAHGAIELEPGLISRSGWAVVDDSDRLVFDATGWLTPRDAAPGSLDLCFFGYGHAYTACLRDYCRIAGPVPLLPRWVLGNWWSRYWAYSAEELLGLMREFQENRVPLSVCIVDMDWHITDTGNRSSGWTGYTWNRELFPDPPAFIQALHRLGLKTALNLHPALGVYPHEEQYPEMAQRLGIDPATDAPVPFDIADPKFTRAYFELLHHPYEAQGIDFWWLDWQQGTETTLQGLDPLWWLNHLHFYDLGRAGKKRRFIFSRWGGLGNHRYPIGFSGDTVVSWESLAFQPYFTATAANVGYGWWSHDVGGHMGGVEDAELFARWVQYGVFSPIFRLHCTKNAYHERRPWGYDAETLRVTREAMQLRHALIPYLYTMSWRDHTSFVPPIRPMYYEHPTAEQAEGRWFDLFSGLSYPGDGWHAVYGELGDIPVFAKAGAILPLGPKSDWGGVETPTALEVHVFPGADNHFELYEDDGAVAHSLIPFSQTWQPQRLRFEIGAAQGDTHHLPTARAFTLYFRGLAEARAAVHKNDAPFTCPLEYDQEAAVLTLGPMSLAPRDTLVVTLTTEEETLLAARDYRLPSCRKLLRACRLDSNVKQMLDMRLNDLLAHPTTLGDFELALDASIGQALAEIITGAGAHASRDPADGQERIILWNNRATPDVTFNFVGQPLVGWSAVRRSGPLPRFAIFKQQGRQLKVDLQGGVQRVDSVTQWINNLADSFQPETVGDLDLVIQFDFSGTDGRQAYARIAERTLTVAPGTHDRPDLTVEADAADWLLLVNGEVDPIEFFRSGKLRVSGDFALSMRLADLFTQSAEQSVLSSERWKLEVNYRDTLTLAFRRP